MNIEKLQENWDQVKGQVKEKFDKLSADDVTSIQGKKDKFIGKLKEKYGYANEKAETVLADFVKNCQYSPQSTSKNQKQNQTASSRV